MAQERIDAVERKVLELTARTPELKGFAARVIEEGARPRDFQQPPGGRVATLALSILVRAMRPPFRLPDSGGFGRSALWDIGE